MKYKHAIQLYKIYNKVEPPKDCLFVFAFKIFIVPSSMHIQHHYRKNIQNKINLKNIQ
jgi:hypothetical protein